MITVEDVKQKLQAEPVHSAEVVGSETEKKKKPFYKKPLFWVVVGVGVWGAIKLAKRGKNAANSLEY